jgi:hypothetical protein
MNYISTIKDSIKQIKEKKVKTFFLFFELIIFVGMIECFDTDAFLIVNFMLVLFFNWFSQKKQITKGLPDIILILTILFILTYFSVGANIFSLTYIGFIIRVITAFLIISYLGFQFFIIFENVVFILALISLPFFIIQLINIKFFNLFTGLSELLLSDERLIHGWGVLKGHRYLVVFGVNSWAEWRNSGFAWEPAGYGAILLWAIFINLVIYNFKSNLKLTILIIASFTTFSNGTYIAGFVLFLYALYNLKGYKSLIIVSVILLSASFLINIPFIKDRIGDMIEKSITYENSINNDYFKNNVTQRKNRVQGTIVSFELLLKKPFGYGLDPKSNLVDIDSASGFASILFKFGFIGAITLIGLLRKVSYTLKNEFRNTLKGWPIFIIFVILTLIANPFSNQPFFLAFILSGHIICLNINTSHKNKKYVTGRNLLIPLTGSFRNKTL